MKIINSSPKMNEIPPPPPKEPTYVELRQKNAALEHELHHLKSICDNQHAIIVNQQPMMAHLQWEASKWNHFKRILEKEKGPEAVAEAENNVAKRMSGLI